VKLKNLFQAVTLTSVIATAASAQTISVNGPAVITANAEGNLGVVYPLLDGRASTAAEREKFVYEIRVNAQYVNLTDASASTFYIAQNGYDDTSPNNQYGFGWAEGVWFRPVTRDYQFRIGYPANGAAGGGVGNNWAEYSFVGNPNAPRPNPNNPGGAITLGTPENPDIPGWDLFWNDEFDGNSLKTNLWNYDVGHYIGGNCNQPGWGNDEAQAYTDNSKNVFLADGKLNLAVHKETKWEACSGGGKNVEYTSGKIVTSGKFSWKYGRIDFCAKLPLGQGFWPALWMMPQNSVYGGWARSGEIDVMEAKGRFPSASSGAIHFGDAWPNNTYIHGDYAFPGGRTINDFNVYSLVWEQAQMRWYVNGNLFRTVNNSQWHSAGAPNNQYAPFDEDFFIIMNLAVGGNFDDGRLPPTSAMPGIMQVDYVRVYKPDGSNSAFMADKVIAGKMASAFAGIRGGQINLNLKSGNYTAGLYDLKGRLIYKTGINAITGINTTGLRVDKLSRGIYFLKVETDGASILKHKILVK